MGEDVFENPSGSREEILAATYRALVEHGYADLTIDKIGDEFEKSQSLVYHHYDGKDDLVLACLEFMLEEFEAAMDDVDDEDPRERLEEVVDWAFTHSPDPERQQFFSTIVELRARASHDPAYREHFTRSDRVIERQLAAIVRDGIEQGVFRECNPDAVASALSTIQKGIIFRRTSADDTAWLEDVRGELEAYLEGRVYAPEE